MFTVAILTKILILSNNIQYNIRLAQLIPLWLRQSFRGCRYRNIRRRRPRRRCR